jgi:hypothetical protein
VLSGETANINFIVFGLTKLGHEFMINRLKASTLTNERRVQRDFLDFDDVKN